MRFWGIVETLHQWMPLERGLDDAALYAPSASVNQSHFTKSRFVRGVYVLFNN